MSSTKPDPALEQTPDVIVVGAGASGAVCALRFAQAGFSVVCLEQGEYPDYAAAAADQIDYETVRSRHFAHNPNRRRGAADYPLNVEGSDIAPLMWNGVGGGTVIYAAAWHRLRPQDFASRSRYGAGDDWPLTYADLAPFYQQVERDFSVSGVGGDPRYPEDYDPPLPPVVFGDLERQVAAAHNALGWHWWPGSNAIASVRHGHLNACVRRGACMTGCFDGAKASVDRTHWPLAKQLGVRLMTGARVTRIECNADNVATGLSYIDQATGCERFLTGGVIVLAANGIGTPRLLLASANDRQPEGLGNSSGQVGQRLMMHPMSSVEGVFDEPLATWQGPTGQRLYSLQFADPEHGVERGAKWQLMGSGGPHETSRLLYWRGRERWGESFHRDFHERFGRSAFWTILAEDLPDPRNRVTLDPDLVDDYGQPAPKITYRISDECRRVLAFNEDRAVESLRLAGARETVTTTAPAETGWHLLGTARMGRDTADSVVDEYGRCHDVPNLLIVDGSIFPTSSPVNPTGTIAALALRNTEAAISRARTQAVSATYERARR